MHVLVAYSQPKGKYTHYVFTILLYVTKETETSKIAVRRNTVTYSCGYCGGWGRIDTIDPSEQRKVGVLELYRYDQVESGDVILIDLQDSALLISQLTFIKVLPKNPDVINLWYSRKFNSYVNESIPYWHIQIFTDFVEAISDKDEKKVKKIKKRYRLWNVLDDIALNRQMEDDGGLYDIHLLNWDMYMQTKAGKMRVEEELIRQTMNAEKITISELLLEPKGQPLVIEGSQRFIEGELRYVE